MEKTATLNLRVNPTVKERAEKVLSQLGVPMSTAIDMYLNQISLTGGIPFSVSLPKAPVSIHADAMTTEEIHQKLEKGYNDIAAGRVQNAAEAFAKFREITNEALADMEQLYNHIAYVLQAPENAMDQYNRIADAILTLDTMAERIRIMESEPERSKEMRRLLVDNYSVFFVIQGDKVIVTDVLYSASDIERLNEKIKQYIKHQAGYVPVKRKVSCLFA